MTKKSISILIPALNEEKNILNLLTDIKEQKINDNFFIESVLVISDGSTDRTNEIVSEFSKNNPIVKLVVNEKRIGKIFSVAKGYQILNTDYLVMFDADIRLKDDTIFQLDSTLNNSNVSLIGGNPVPFEPKSIFNIAEQASMFSWHLVQAIKNIQPKSIYSAHGRILMLSKSLYKNINIESLSTPGDDQFIYLQSSNSFEFADKAIVFYRLPSTVTDYLKQNTRFRRAKAIRDNANYNINHIFYVENKYRILLNVSFRNPFRFLCWLYLYSRGLFEYKLQGLFRTDDSWGVANSTK